MAKLTIDGIPAEVPDGSVLLEACKAVGVEVPNFCYYPKLALIGACRMCLVEIKAGPVPPPVLAKPQASCTTTVRGDGWEILTNSPKVEKLRKGILEFLLLNHSLTCPTCDMGGECELQDNTWRYGPGVSRMYDPKQFREIHSLGPFVDLNMQRCVQCQRCTRYCDEVMGNKALGMQNRGAATQIFGFPGEDLDCVLCGNCIEVCPVGAITSDQFDTKARRWDRVETATVCTYCGDGCSMKLDTKNTVTPANTPAYGVSTDHLSGNLYGNRGRVLRTRAFVDSGILTDDYKGNNEEFLCHKGRFGFHVIHHDQRLTTPLVRRNGELQPATWPEAMKAAADGFNRILNSDGPDAMGGIGSEKTTNEESYLFQKFIRTVFRTNNVDHRVSVKELQTELPPEPKQTTIPDLYKSTAILVIGAGITEQNPLTESRVRLAVRRNRASLVVAGSRRSLIADETSAFLRCNPGAEAALVFAMAHALIPARQSALEADVQKTQAALDPAAMEKATQGGRVPLEVVQKGAESAAAKAKAAMDAFSVPATLTTLLGQLSLEKAAELSGCAVDRVLASVKSLAGSPSLNIVVGQDIYKGPGGRQAVVLLRALCRAFGWPAPAETLEHNNTRGARDVGLLPDLLPGYKSFSDTAARESLATAWGVDSVPGKAGMNTHEMLQAAATSRLKGLYIVGSNPLVTYAGGDLARRALEKVEFLVVQDVFLTETAKGADVVFPAALWAEKDGTFTNWEGRIQRVRPAVNPPGQAQSDDLIFGELARAMGQPWRDGSSERVFTEIGEVSGIYGGISREDLEKPTGEGVLWPKQNGVEAALDLKVPDLSELKADAAYSHVLLWGNDTYHHGSMTSWDEGPRTAEGHAYVEVNPADARSLGVSEGDGVIVESPRSKLDLPCRITDDVASGQVFVPTTFPETPANLLLDAGRILERVKLSKGTPRSEMETEREAAGMTGVGGPVTGGYN